MSTTTFDVMKKRDEDRLKALRTKGMDVTDYTYDEKIPTLDAIDLANRQDPQLVKDNEKSIITLLIYKDFASNVMEKLFNKQTTQIAMFHTFFNVACTIIFTPFTNVFVKVAKFLIKDKEDKKSAKFIALLLLITFLRFC